MSRQLVTDHPGESFAGDTVCIWDPRGAEGDDADAGRLGAELEVMGMAVYNGKLYAGTLPLAQVYRQQIEGTKAQTVTKVEAARAEIMRMIRQMMAKGEVDYRLYEEATLG